jgi:hypothetical protein
VGARRVSAQEREDVDEYGYVHLRVRILRIGTHIRIRTVCWMDGWNGWMGWIDEFFL